MNDKLNQNDIAARSVAGGFTRASGGDGQRLQYAFGCGEFAKRGHDEEILYRNTKVTSEGKQILVNFIMPRQTASEMLKKQLPPSG